MSEICGEYPKNDISSKEVRPSVRKLIEDLQAGKVDLSLKNYKPDILNVEVSEEPQNEIQIIDLQSNNENKNVGFLGKIRKAAIITTAAAGLASFANIVDIKPVQAAENPTRIVEMQQQNIETKKVLEGLVDPENFFNSKNKREIALTKDSLYGFKTEYLNDTKEFFWECGYVGTPVEFGSRVLVSPSIVENAAKKLNESGKEKTASNFIDAIFKESKVLDASNCKSPTMMIFVTEKDRHKYYYTMSGTNPLFTKLIPGGKPENVSPSDEGKFKYDLDSEEMVLVRKIDGSVKHYKENVTENKIQIKKGVSVMVGETEKGLSSLFTDEVLKPTVFRAEELLGMLGKSLAEERELVFIRCDKVGYQGFFYFDPISKCNVIGLKEEVINKVGDSWGGNKGKNLEYRRASALEGLITEWYGLYGLKFDKYVGIGKTIMEGYLAKKVFKLTPAEYKMFMVGCKASFPGYFKDECNNDPIFFQENVKQYLVENYGIPSKDIDEVLKEIGITK